MNLTEKKTALSLIDERAALFEGIADRIWENPELSLKEFQARDLYCRALRELGFSVTENLCGIGTAFCGSYGSGRPVIGILGEFDALSGLSQEAGAISPKPVTEGGCGHGCGHNLLGAGSLAAAAAVIRLPRGRGGRGKGLYGTGRSLEAAGRCPDLASRRRKPDHDRHQQLLHSGPV